MNTQLIQLLLGCALTNDTSPPEKMTPVDTARIVLSTAGSAEEAARIARTLVEEGLAACVNLLPGVRSIYRWQGQIQDEAEWMLLIKTNTCRLAPLEDRLTSLHSYQTPEFLVIVPESGSAAYLLWIDECLSQIGRGEPPSV